MKSPIVVIGENLIRDKELLKLLKKIAKVSSVRDIELFAKDHRRIIFKLAVIELSNTRIDAFQAMQSIRLRLPNLTIIVVNGGGPREAVIHSYRAGVKDFFKKPYSPHLLAERVEALLKNNKQ